jgi:hypothetical protein
VPLYRGDSQKSDRRRKDAARIRTEQAQIGARVKVGEESGLRSEWRGLTGTISGKWGNPEYLALDVLLDDGTQQLFWHHELEEISERA